MTKRMTREQFRAQHGEVKDLIKSWAIAMNIPGKELGFTKKSWGGTKAKPAKSESGPDMLHRQVVAAGLHAPDREVRFHPTRKWRFDLAWPTRLVACEVDGGLYIQGGHTRGAAREGDYEKDAEAMALGWRVLRVSTGQVKNGKAVEWLRRVLGVG